MTCSPILRWARSRHSTRPGIGKYRLGRITTHVAFTKRVQEHIPVGQKQNRKNGQGVLACSPILRWDRSQHSTRPDTLETRPPSQMPSALRWRRTSSITETSSPRCPPSKLTTVAPIWCATFRIPSAPPKKRSYRTTSKTITPYKKAELMAENCTSCKGQTQQRIGKHITLKKR